MSYITIRKISKFQYWWAEVELFNSGIEKIKWVDEANAKFLTKSYGIDPTTIANLLNRGTKLDEIIRVPCSVLESNALN